MHLPGGQYYACLALALAIIAVIVIKAPLFKPAPIFHKDQARMQGAPR